MNAAELLGQILAAVGEPSAGGVVELVGSDPVLPSPLRIGEAGAATIGAAGLAAARLWEARGGRAQAVRVHVDAAAAAMRSGRYLRVLPAASESGSASGGVRIEHFAPRATRGGTGVFASRDGRWVYLHRNFAHHRQRICSVLGCADDETAIAAAVKAWDGAALEDAIVQAGACAALVRSAAEWRVLEQARAVADLPLLEIDRVGDSPPERLPTHAAPGSLSPEPPLPPHAAPGSLPPEPPLPTHAAPGSLSPEPPLPPHAAPRTPPGTLPRGEPPVPPDSPPYG